MKTATTKSHTMLGTGSEREREREEREREREREREIQRERRRDREKERERELDQEERGIEEEGDIDKHCETLECGVSKGIVDEDIWILVMIIMEKIHVKREKSE